jgi:hypothetical protein
VKRGGTPEAAAARWAGVRPPCGTGWPRPRGLESDGRVTPQAPPSRRRRGCFNGWGGALFEGRQMPETPWPCAELDGSGRQNPSGGDGEVGIPRRLCPAQITWTRWAMCGDAAICVICLPNRTRQKKVGGCNICGQPRRHTYLARYMRGRKKKTVRKRRCHFGLRPPLEATRVIRPSRCFHVASLGRYPRQSGWHCG